MKRILIQVYEWDKVEHVFLAVLIRYSKKEGNERWYFCQAQWYGSDYDDYEEEHA